MLISGKVQGVYYRASTNLEAKRLGLSGWVMNLHDGRVAVEAEGPEADVEALIRWCRQGPPEAVVTDVVITELPLMASTTPFEVRR